MQPSSLRTFSWSCNGCQNSGGLLLVFQTGKKKERGKGRKWHLAVDSDPLNNFPSGFVQQHLFNIDTSSQERLGSVCVCVSEWIWALWAFCYWGKGEWRLGRQPAISAIVTDLIQCHKVNTQKKKIGMLENKRFLTNDNRTSLSVCVCVEAECEKEFWSDSYFLWKR